MNIYQKLIEVRKEVPYLKKENEGYQFKYVSSSQVLGNLKSKMDELGLLLVPSVTRKEVSQDSVENKDKAGNLKRTTTYFTELEMDFTWINADVPSETITCKWYGQGVDTAGEKGVGKALTYSEKYFMLKFFNIPTDKDDPDSFQDKIDNNGKSENKDKTDPAKNKTESKSTVQTGSKNLASEAQLKRMFTMMTEAGADEEKFKSYLYEKYKIASSKELTKSQIEEVYKVLETKIEAKKQAEAKELSDGFDAYEKELEGAKA